MTSEPLDHACAPVLPAARILVVDDEQAIRRTLAELFAHTGYQATEAASGRAALELMARQRFDLVILDLNMPGMEGTEVLQAARPLAPDTVFIILTGYGTLDSAIIAIRHGAFDYLIKPSSVREILHTVEAGLAERKRRLGQEEPTALLERALAGLKAAAQGQGSVAPPVERFLQVSGVTLDALRRLAVVGGQPIELTATEFEILVYLIRHRNRAVSCRELVAHLRGYDIDEREARILLRTHIHRLRQKLERGPAGPHLIRTVRGSGYIIDATEPA